MRVYIHSFVIPNAPTHKKKSPFFKDTVSSFSISIFHSTYIITKIVFVSKYILHRNKGFRTIIFLQGTYELLDCSINVHPVHVVLPFHIHNFWVLCMCGGCLFICVVNCVGVFICFGLSRMVLVSLYTPQAPKNSASSCICLPDAKILHLHGPPNQVFP